MYISLINLICEFVYWQDKNKAGGLVRFNLFDFSLV